MMKRSQMMMVAGVSAVGLVCGFAVRGGNDGGAFGGRDGMGDGTRDLSFGPRRLPKPEFEPSTLKSSDRLEDLVGLPNRELYGRLALWMMDADEAQIAAFWSEYVKREDKSRDIDDLVFINWTRVNPAGATAAVEGTEYEHFAWWAWTCHDPEAALAEALVSHPERVADVAWGCGEFHPEWAREHFDDFPMSERMHVLSGMAKWSDGDDPLATLDFLKQHGYGADAGTLRLLARKDPWAAYEWVRKNGASEGDPFSGRDSPLDSLMQTLGEEYPKVLEQLAGQTPSGALKWRMEEELFKNLMATDPDAAIAQAKEIEAPRIASERWAALGNEMLEKDPARAFEMAEQLLLVSPELFSSPSSIELGKGRIILNIHIDGTDALVDGLLRENPARLMNLVTKSSVGESFDSNTAYRVGRSWAERDLNGLAGWASELEPSSARDVAGSALVDLLRGQERFQEAAEWLGAYSNNEQVARQAKQVFAGWNRVDPEAAAQGLKSTKLSDELKKDIMRYQPMK